MQRRNIDTEFNTDGLMTEINHQSKRYGLGFQAQLTIKAIWFIYDFKKLSYVFSFIDVKTSSLSFLLQVFGKELKERNKRSP